jgi:predicted transposase/invertase (TIGR01784 family)
MNDYLDPKVDFVFKRIFGSEENKDVLLAFLNAALRETEPKPLTQIILVNTHIDKNALEDKQSVLDIRAKTAEGKQINLEIQLSDKYDMAPRTLYYWAKMYEDQLAETQLYKELKKTITINILNFSMLPNDRFHNTFHLREDHTGLLLTDHIEIHFMELPKLEEKAYSLDDRLVKWLIFLKGVPKERWEELAMDMPELKKAMTTLEFLSQDKEARYLYEMRKKALLDERSALDYAETRGEQKKAAEVARNLLSAGKLTIAEIAEVTGISEEEVQKLKEQIH